MFAQGRVSLSFYYVWSKDMFCIASVLACFGLCRLCWLCSNLQVWTKEETDQLFEFCQNFDLRFVVIADRFPVSRTVEELKDRYYSGMLDLLCFRTIIRSLIPCPFIFFHIWSLCFYFMLHQGSLKIHGLRILLRTFFCSKPGPAAC